MTEPITRAGIVCPECGAAKGEWCFLHGSLVHPARLREVSEINRLARKHTIEAMSTAELVEVIRENKDAPLNSDEHWVFGVAFEAWWRRDLEPTTKETE